jgi:hypothetical protein
MPDSNDRGQLQLRLCNLRPASAGRFRAAHIAWLRVCAGSLTPTIRTSLYRALELCQADIGFRLRRTPTSPRRDAMRGL